MPRALLSASAWPFLADTRRAFPETVTPACRFRAGFAALTRTLRADFRGETAKMPSFDVVSKVAWHEIENALNQAQKELSQRFDFKDTETTAERTKEGLLIQSSSDDRVKAAQVVLQEKLIKRKVSLKYFEFPKQPEPTGRGGAKILVAVKEGIEADPARKLVAALKESKIKVQASIQDAQLRVTGKNKDDLQKAIQLLRGGDFGLELQFTNFRE
jgi:cyclic-di-GMP-binding protein